MKIVPFIYMRQDSHRLPGKHFKPVYRNVPLIDMVVNRLCRRFSRGQIYVLTSDRLVDDVIERYFCQSEITVVRGSTKNLVARTIAGIDISGADYFLRVNGDSPLIDMRLIDYACDQLRKSPYAVVSNLFKRSFPYGVSAELISSEFFEEVRHFATPSDEEHVTRHIYSLPSSGRKMCSIQQNTDDSSVRLTVDTSRDLEKIRVILSQAEGQFTNYKDLLKLGESKLTALEIQR